MVSLRSQNLHNSVGRLNLLSLTFYSSNCDVCYTCSRSICGMCESCGLVCLTICKTLRVSIDFEKERSNSQFFMSNHLQDTFMHLNVVTPLHRYNASGFKISWPIPFLREAYSMSMASIAWDSNSLFCRRWEKPIQLLPKVYTHFPSITGLSIRLDHLRNCTIWVPDIIKRYQKINVDSQPWGFVREANDKPIFCTDLSVLLCQIII